MLLVVLAAFSSLPGAIARAVELDQLQEYARGRAAFRDRPGAAGDRADLSFSGTTTVDAPAPSAACPTVTRVRIATDTSTIGPITLDCARWRSSRAGQLLSYRDPDRATPVESLRVLHGAKQARLDLRLRGAAYGTGVPVGPLVHAVAEVRVGDVLYCGRLAAPRRDDTEQAVFRGTTAGCVPGVVVDYEPSPTIVDWALERAQFLASPSITILPNGDYVVTHDIFGGGSTEATSGITDVFRSSDRGQSWTQVATLHDQFWSTVFVHQGALYVFGYTSSGDGDMVIRRSQDGGSTWTTPLDAQSGLLREGNFGGTPNAPVVHGGRIWIGQGTRLMSAPVDADLLAASSWTRSNGIPTDAGWLGGTFTFWSEGQVVASPQEGVVLLPKVGDLAYSALLRAATPQTLAFDGATDFVELPGAEKKFGAAYDPVSERFYVLSNPVLPEHADDQLPFGNPPSMLRNTAAVLSSTDLRNWEVDKIFLYSPKVANEAFQYLNFAFDGDDLAVISRTALDVGGNLPPRGHESNLITFHRIPGFRDLAPEHVLVADPMRNVVERFERTQHESAPLGPFALGTSFAGAPLLQPVALAQDAAGSVYVREQGGRILRFDAAGNFLDVVPSAPVPFRGRKLEVAQPAAGERTWTRPASGTWAEPTSWYYWGRADGAQETAVFGSAAPGPATVTLERPVRVRGLRFRNAATYTLAGPGALDLGGGAEDGIDDGVLDVQLGAHVVAVPVTLADRVAAQLGATTSLTLAGPLDLDGHELAVAGAGALAVTGDLALGGGRLVVTGERAVQLGDTAALTLDGTLELRPAAGVTLQAGDAFDLLDFAPPLGTTFAAVELPALATGLGWDASALYTTGVVTVTATP